MARLSVGDQRVLEDVEGGVTKGRGDVRMGVFEVNFISGDPGNMCRMAKERVGARTSARETVGATHSFNEPCLVGLQSKPRR
jgi:hypothetical protein